MSVVEGHAVTSDGAVLHWSSEGEGPPLLLIAGQARAGGSWSHLVPQLVARYRVLLYDHRGVGGSTCGGKNRFTTRTLAGDALSVLDAAGIGIAHVYGHSMGGRVAQWLAIDYPDRVARLVLASTTGGDRLDEPRAPEVSARLIRGTAGEMGPLFFTETFRRQHPYAVNEFFRRDASISARRAHFAASKGHDAWSEVHRIASPTLVLHGTDDPVTPVASARRLAKRISNAELFIEAGQLHCLHLESLPAQRHIDEFLYNSA